MPETRLLLRGKVWEKTLTEVNFAARKKFGEPIHPVGFFVVRFCWQDIAPAELRYTDSFPDEQLQRATLELIKIDRKFSVGLQESVKEVLQRRSLWGPELLQQYNAARARITPVFIEEQVKFYHQKEPRQPVVMAADERPVGRHNARHNFFFFIDKDYLGGFFAG